MTLAEILGISAASVGTGAASVAGVIWYIVKRRGPKLVLEALAAKSQAWREAIVETAEDLDSRLVRRTDPNLVSYEVHEYRCLKCGQRVRTSWRIPENLRHEYGHITLDGNGRCNGTLEPVQ
jgi:hypothetical protein